VPAESSGAPAGELLATRTLVAWCPDWPVTAAGHPPGERVAIVAVDRVLAASAAARREGVTRGLRRREAQARCPGLVVLADDPGRDGRAFEVVVAAVETLTPRVAVVAPGTLAVPTRGPSRYFGGDAGLAATVTAVIDAAVEGSWPGAPGVRVGVADGLFAARLAARRAGPRSPVVVPPGAAGEFLGPWPVGVLPDQELAGLFGRLGLVTLADLAALPVRSVLSRFGTPGLLAHRLACGLDEIALELRSPTEDLSVSAQIDPPAPRSDVAAFVARALAGQVEEKLAGRGLVCSQIAVEVETEHGERRERIWHHDGPLDAASIAERVRWQLEGWVKGEEVTGSLTLLRLTPSGLRAGNGSQGGLWGGGDGGGVGRALARVQGLLGPWGVLTATVGGGRDPLDAVTFLPWGEPRRPARPGAPEGLSVPPPSPARGRASRPDPPWPGRLPAPSPALTRPRPLPAGLWDGSGSEVTVSGRGLLSRPPVAVAVGGGAPAPVEGWAGPWPLEERWWEAGRRRARLQVVAGDGSAHLLVREAGQWWAAATYD